jgi:hypothetical protein
MRRKQQQGVVEEVSESYFLWLVAQESDIDAIISQ